MNNLATPLAILIGAALIAAAILISNGFYEFESPHRFITHRYNKLTGSIYICVYGRPCEPSERRYEATGRDLLPERLPSIVPSEPNQKENGGRSKNEVLPDNFQIISPPQHNKEP
jgi:hypothetical protein